MRAITYEPEIVAFAERCFSLIYNDTFENVLKKEQQKAETERQKAETERKKAETERQKAETERKKAETERKKAETERKKAETERKKVEEIRQKAILNLHHKLGLEATNIASLLELDLSIVQEIIDKTTAS